MSRCHKLRDFLLCLAALRLFTAVKNQDTTLNGEEGSIFSGCSEGIHPGHVQGKPERAPCCSVPPDQRAPSRAAERGTTQAPLRS